MRSTSSRIISSASTAVALRPSMFDLHGLVEVVDVVEEDVVQVVDGGLDVARHGDVDQKHRAVLAAADDGAHLVAREDVMRRAAGGEQISTSGKASSSRLVVDHAAVELAGEGLGALPRAIRDEYFGHTGAAQMTQRGFGHLPRPDHQDAFSFERTEDVARQLDRGVADGDGAFANVGFRTHALGDVEGAGHHQVEESAERAVLFGHRVGAFELAENLRLADDHRIEAGRDAKQMADRVRAVVAVQIRHHPGSFDGAGFGEECFDGAAEAASSAVAAISTRLQVDRIMPSSRPGTFSERASAAGSECSSKAIRSRTSTGAVR